MHVPPTLSEEFVDAVVDLSFQVLRGMDDGELIQLLNAIFHIAEMEVRRSALAERLQWMQRLSQPSRQ